MLSMSLQRLPHFIWVWAKGAEGSSLDPAQKNKQQINWVALSSSPHFLKEKKNQLHFHVLLQVSGRNNIQ